jgi:hypothetical protein
MGASLSASHNIHPDTSSYFTISTMVILPPCHHSGVVLWGLIIRQGIIFLSTTRRSIQTLWGLAPPTQATSLIILAHSITSNSGGSISSSILPRKLLYKHNTTIIYQHCKTIYILWGLYRYFCSLISVLFPKMLTIVWSPFDVKDGG